MLPLKAEEQIVSTTQIIKIEPQDGAIPSTITVRLTSAIGSGRLDFISSFPDRGSKVENEAHALRELSNFIKDTLHKTP